MDTNKTVTTNFTKRTYNLSVNINPPGAGNVVINPTSGPYVHDTWVKLQATANTGWSFVNYSGNLASSNAYDSIYMNSDKTVTTNFEINYYTLTLNTAGNGVATKTPDTLAYYYGQVVRLDAYPATGWSFRNWSGSFSSTANPEFILMNGNKNITATFRLDTFTITASSGLHGSVTPSGVTYLGYGEHQTYHI